MTSRARSLALLAAVAVTATVAPATAPAAFDGAACPQGTGALEPADGKLCIIDARPYGYPDITLTDGKTNTVRKRPATAAAFPPDKILGGQAPPASSLLFTYYRDDLNQKAPVVIVEHGGSWLKYEDPLLGSYGGSRGWGDPTAKFMAYRGFVAITSDAVAGNQNQIRKMGLEAIAREGQRNRQTLVRLLRTEHERFGIDPDRIYVTGESAGGAEALRLALRSEDTGSVANRRLVGINDGATSSHIRGAFVVGASDCGFPGVLPEKLRAGRKVFNWQGNWSKYFLAPNIAPVHSTKVTTLSPSLLQNGAPAYRWTGGPQDEALDFETDKGFGTCGPSDASTAGDAPFGLASGVHDEILPISNVTKTCQLYLPPKDPRGLCDAYYAMDSPNTYYGGLDIKSITDYAVRKVWAGNLPLAQWPKDLQTWPGIGADHWMILPPFKKGANPVKNYDHRLSWAGEDLAIRFAWFCKHGADVPLCSSPEAPQ